jgi:hypothetical protein
VQLPGLPGQPPAGSGNGSSSSQGAGSNASPSGTTRSGSVNATRRRFSTRGKRRGTTVTFRLGGPAKVVFTVYGPSPSCGIAGTKSVRGRRGINRVHLTGRFNGRTLAPGTYSIVVVARRGSHWTRVGDIAVQVVARGRRVQRAGSPPVFRCAATVAQTGIPGAGLFLAPPSKTRSRVIGPPQVKPESNPGRSGVLGAPPFHLGTGSSGMNLVLAVLLYGALGIGGAVLLVYAVRYFRGTWSP